MRELYEWGRWADEIPMLEIPPNILVKAIPPFGGAVIRYAFASKDNPEKEVSVYLDCYDELGCVGKPYYEIYPAEDGDCLRFFMNETEELMAAISAALKTKEN